MFNNPLSIKGRIRRKEYVFSLLIFFVLFPAVVFIHASVEQKDTFISFIAFLPFWFIVTQGSKRCHDIGLNGWFQVIPLFFIVLVFKEGQRGANFFGVNPKGIQKQEKTRNNHLNIPVAGEENLRPTNTIRAENNYKSNLINRIIIFIEKLNKEQKIFYSITIPIILFFITTYLAGLYSGSSGAFDLSSTFLFWFFYLVIISVLEYFIYVYKPPK